MKRIAFSIIALIILICACNSGSGKKLIEGTTAYHLAESIGEKLPVLKPAANNVLVSAKFFKITTADVVLNIQQSPGTDLGQFYKLDETQLRTALESITLNLAKRKLILKAAVDAGITCSDAEVEEVYKSFYDKFGGEAGFQKELERIAIDIDQFKLELRNGIKRQKYIDDIILKSKTVSQKELEAAYAELTASETVSLRHILLKTDGMSVSQKEAILQKMKKIRSRAVRGENFGTLAKKYSDDTASRETGGLFENIKPGELLKPFNDQAFSVKVGKVSEIFETAMGYHILKIIDRSGETRPLSEIRADLEKQLQQYKENQALGLEIAHLKIKAGMVMLPF